MQRSVTNWNQYPLKMSEITQSRFRDDLQLDLKNHKNAIARGNGRCYGDASLSENIHSTLRLKNILSFDKKKGIIQCESGVLLSDLLELIVPEKWFLPVTPGTKFITIGGAMASDVHGKNHHKEGSFSSHILSAELLKPTGEIIEISQEKNRILFDASCGGMGLSGIILSVKFRLKQIESPFIKQSQIRAKNLDTILQLFEKYSDSTYSMAWIDCLSSGKSRGRSVMFVGEHAKVKDVPSKMLKKTDTSKRKLNVPFNFPSFSLNKLSVKLFNAVYYRMNKTKLNQIIHYDPFFYPLDSIHNWNRIYGKKGFLQYQFVIPLHQGKKTLEEILRKIEQKGWGSFLAVLKRFGKQESLIAFPMEGYTLALDFPLRNGLFEFLDELDEIVHNANGRIYLSKDARMKADCFYKGYPHAQEFKELINELNPKRTINSELAKRLDILEK